MTTNIHDTTMNDLLIPFVFYRHWEAASSETCFLPSSVEQLAGFGF